jgi:hypothetical protein
MVKSDMGQTLARRKAKSDFICDKQILVKFWDKFVSKTYNKKDVLGGKSCQQYPKHPQKGNSPSMVCPGREAIKKGVNRLHCDDDVLHINDNNETFDETFV